MTTEVEHYMRRCAELSRRLAEVEQALRELDAAAVEFGDGGNDLVIGARFALAVNRCRAVLDKGEPDG